MNLPSREECEGWDPAQVAFFLCKIKMSECAVTVNRLRINGQRFLNLSDSEMSKFSLIHQPIKNKQRPNLPPRDYRDNMEEDEQLSDAEYDNDMYEDPREDDSYEPPPSHRVFNSVPSASFPRAEYLDSCRNRPGRPPKRPPRPDRASRQLPPEPTQDDSDEEDYINPDANNDDDNYVEPAENPPANPLLLSGSRAGRGRPMLPPHLAERQPRPGFFDVSDGKDKSVPSPVSRLCPMPPSQSPSIPPKPSPRVAMTRSPMTVVEPTGDDEYEVCDADKGSSDEPAEVPPPRLPKPLPRERSPKPPTGPRPDLKPREFESRSLPLMPADQKLPPKPFSLDLKRPKIPLPQLTSPKPPERGVSVSADNGSLDQDKDSDLFRKPWYASSCDRKTADDVLLHFNKDGAFMVRKSSGHDAHQPYTLVVFYGDRVYNIPIRFIPSTHQYALGREKKGEEYFNSICHIIENHQRNPLVLIDSQSYSKDATKLCFPVKP